MFDVFDDVITKRTDYAASVGSAEQDLLRDVVRKLLDALEDPSRDPEIQAHYAQFYHAARMLTGRTGGNWDGELAERGMRWLRGE